MMTVSDIFRFQLGHEKAIRRVLESRWSLLVGAIFVVTAGIARHYDQKYLIWEWWVVQPFIIGVVSAFAIFLTAWIGLRMGRPKRDDRPHFFHQFLSFLGAFLMTAPLAWLYAIPVEQWMSLEAAARVNIVLLAVVALWRVALMVRVLNLVTGAGWFRCLVVVLLPSSVEALFLSTFLHMQLVGLMGGVQLPPHEEILNNALNMVSVAAFWIGVAAFVLWIYLAFTRKIVAVAFPVHRKGAPKRALIFSAVALVVWTAYAWPWQVKQYHRFMVRHYMGKGDYRSALQFGADRNREAFPSPGHMPPDPLDPYGGTSGLIEMLKALQEGHPLWLREEYYRNAETAIFSRTRYSRVGEILEALLSAPGGNEFVSSSPERWLQLLEDLGPSEPGGYYRESDYQPCRAALEKTGIDLPPHPGPAGEYRVD